jgi:hypothetical protein
MQSAPAHGHMAHRNNPLTYIESENNLIHRVPLKAFKCSMRIYFLIETVLPLKVGGGSDHDDDYDDDHGNDDDDDDDLF